jgi:hypothetical protein
MRSQTFWDQKTDPACRFTQSELEIIYVPFATDGNMQLSMFVLERGQYLPGRFRYPVVDKCNVSFDLMLLIF